ncbi:MAG: GNAT family N-acetyltransferase [Betaproteobacteria bacterium]|nr:MAG: GNAT family N-acetyltransferase [Betaproteobacteria bacterium]
MTTDVAPDDQRFMREALALAAAAGAAGEVPIAALVVVNGEVIGRGANRVIRDQDTTAHAEMVALRDAFKTVNNYRVPGATVYTTVEPCAMCAGALLHARVSRVVWGAPDAKFGAAGSVFDLFANAKLNHHARDVVGHVCHLEAAQLLKDFFASKRERREVRKDHVLQVKTVTWQDDQSTLKDIRFEVFVEEQGVPAAEEVDRWDPLCIHAIAWVDGIAAGCGRLLPDGHIGRMAVRKPWRGRNIGAAVLEHLIERSRQRGDVRSVLSAQTHAIGFYEKFGYAAYGPEYLDCDIPHRDMQKFLKDCE